MNHCNHHYFLTFVDDFNRQTWVFLFVNKLEARIQLQNFVKFAKVQFGASTKIIRIDDGSEFFMPAFYANYGILHRNSCAYTP